MASGIAPEIPTGGFNFGNFQRNLKLDCQGVSPPKAVKTGTTIVGLIFENGVVLGADTRATAGNVVADKNCRKSIDWHPGCTVAELELQQTLK